MKLSIDLMGGLGNQLFQIFATLSYAIDQNKEVVFSEVLFSGDREKVYWDDFLRTLKFNYLSSIDQYEYEMDFIERYKELDFKYSPLPEFSKNTILSGYFQSYKYFENNYEKIIDIIELRKKQEEFRIYAKNCVSMHFRLGDYKKIEDCHPIMPIDYFETALEYLNKDKILYFYEKEDKEVVRGIVDSLSLKFNTIEFIAIDDSIEDWQQMLIMSCCDHNIIANSTFSWWGAYFNDNPKKIVCYPSRWFGPKITHDTCDLFPDDWIKLQV